MGAKTWMLVYASANVREALRDGPQLDRDATLKLVQDLFPKETLTPSAEGNLSYTCPPDDELHVGCFRGVSVVAAKEFGIDHPSRLPSPFIAYGGSKTMYLHAMHSVVDWFACAQWTDGRLVRSLSLSPDNGILEDIGERLAFERPYWAGEHPATDDEEESYPFPFHPLELGEAALEEFFGYRLEGAIDPSLIDPESVPLIKYKRSRSRWKLW
jgi:hypothetical protein